jgi:NAD-dependent dihydropyrimidine dehydrogenase PreA subunit
MSEKKLTVTPEPALFNSVTFEPEICNGCNLCIDVCQVDILYPNPEEGKPPVVLYPGECWYGGCCVAICPKHGAIELRIPLANRVHWKPKVQEK